MPPAPRSSSVADRLARLAPDQRAAATAAAGPVLCVAPAGSGKTTVLVARIAWLIDGGADPEQTCAVTFNRRASVELRERVDPAVAPLGVAPRAVRVATFHALGREILLDAGRTGAEQVADRDPLLRELFPDAAPADRRTLDDAFSRLKLDAFVTADDVAADPEPGAIGMAFVAYQRGLADRGRLDFDDLVAEAVRALESTPALLKRWRTRTAELLVDEAQDLDRTQLRLALLLAAPANRIFLVGDDDQSIYGWRLADVRRILGLAAELPGIRRFDLETNYRCPAVVVDRADRLISVNRERFVKRIRPRPDAPGTLVLAGDGADDSERAERIIEGWPDGTSSRAILARTNRNLHPAAVAALQLNRAFTAPDLTLLVESPQVDVLIGVARATIASRPFLPAFARAVRGSADAPGTTRGPAEVGEARVAAEAPNAGGAEAPDAGGAEPDGASRTEIAEALVAWAAPYTTLDELAAAIAGVRAALATLRRDDAPLTLATAHGTKGLEFDHVAVIDMDEGRFPSGRALAEASDPERTMEEERRLGYVAWTRARRTLTLAYDPGAPSTFLREAFTDDELAPRRDPRPR